MRTFLRIILPYAGFFVSSFLTIFAYEKNPDNNLACFKHNIQLQLHDENGFPVDGTKFWVELTIHKEGNKVNISFPAINFEIGPQSQEDPEFPYSPGPGFLRTVDGFLPAQICPTDSLYRSYLVPSNIGESLPFSYLTPPSEYPVPPVGYNVGVTFFGGIVIQGAGTFGNLIPVGSQVMLPTDIFYYTEPTKALSQNTRISVGASNFTEFSGGFYGPAGTSIRDTHVNDAFDNVVAWTWVDNANQTDKSNDVDNVMVAIGTVKNGQLTVGTPIQLSSNPNPDGTYSWDTAVAINRANPKNIVVSWGTNNKPTYPYRAVSFDGGLTWPSEYNGPTNIQPTGLEAAGDNRGVASDKYGNIWYGTTNLTDDLGNYIDQPTFWVSPDGGVTFTVAYTVPLPSVFNLGVDFLDIPEFCFGSDGQGNYGLWFAADYYISYGEPFPIDIVPLVGFVPITGAMTVGGPVPIGSIPASTPSILYDFNNTQYVPCLTAANDGRVWRQAYVDTGIIYMPYSLVFKSPPNSTYPDPVTSNYAGPWQLSTVFDPGSYTFAPTTISYVSGYFISPQNLIYDEGRQALYSVIATQAPDDFGTVAPLLSQNMRLYLLISRDNGQTWTKPIYISSTNFANRGFPSMALDTVTGNLIFGWYDGRNDPTYKALEYYGAVIPAAQLDALVNVIPLSNPQYIVPPANGCTQITCCTGVTGCQGQVCCTGSTGCVGITGCVG